MKLHPDKNPSPLASEAFKKVSTAFQCLTNPKAREEYDLYGDEERVVNHQRYQQEFVTPEQLFEAFFGIHQRGNVFHFSTRPNTAGGNNRYYPIFNLIIPHFPPILYEFS